MSQRERPKPLFCVALYNSCKKNDNFTIGNRRAQGSGDILPAGGAVDTAQCPHAPVTMHCRACGRCRDALPGHYLCCDGADRRVCRSSHRMMYSRARNVGGSSLPSGWRRILGQGHFHPPTCAGATVRAQKVDKFKDNIGLQKVYRPFPARASPRGIQRRPVPSRAKHG
jgi:hypothetical protein